MGPMGKFVLLFVAVAILLVVALRATGRGKEGGDRDRP